MPGVMGEFSFCSKKMRGNMRNISVRWYCTYRVVPGKGAQPKRINRQEAQHSTNKKISKTMRALHDVITQSCCTFFHVNFHKDQGCIFARAFSSQLATNSHSILGFHPPYAHIEMWIPWRMRSDPQSSLVIQLRIDLLHPCSFTLPSLFRLPLLHCCSLVIRRPAAMKGQLH